MLRQSCEISRQSSTAIFLDQCRDRVVGVGPKFCLLTSFMSQHSLLCRNIYQSISLLFMSPPSYEMSRQSSFMDLVKFDLYCDITLLVMT